MNNTATGGFLFPNPQPPTLYTNPPGLNFVQFLQTVLAGLSGFSGSLVRPEWQVKPPSQPDIFVDWLAFGISGMTPDFNAYIGYDQNGDPFLQRNELITLAVSVYGPNSYDNVALIRDGFQLTQNLASLKAANVGFGYDAPAIHVPDLVNERWVDRWRVEFFLRRQIQRFYPILNFVSLSGTFYTQTAVDPNYSQNFSATGS